MHDISKNGLTDDYLESVRDALSSAESSIEKITHSEYALLDKLADQLCSLHHKGFSFVEISLLLKRCGVDLSAENIRNYYFYAFESRLKTCEQTILDLRRPEWNAVVERTAFIERGLRQALKNDSGLILHYQPQIDIQSGKVLGAEALVRLECNGNLISPSEFIPVAENSNLIVLVGEWVLREACKEAKRWQTLGLGGQQGIKVGVNLSVKQFSTGLPNMVHEILCDSGLPTRLLGLEITESFLVGGNESLKILHTLRDSGIHLSIDDFGTGYSCLSQLKDLPLDTIKIDKAFVNDLEKNEGSAVVETIVDLADKLQMTTLAEGVESKGQAQALKILGCPVCQGYLFAKPLSGADFVRYVESVH